MKNIDKMREHIFDIIKNQMTDNEPPETNKAYHRCIEGGYNDHETKQLIGQCIAVEILKIAKNNQPFNKDRYVKNLNNLPKEPIE